MPVAFTQEIVSQQWNAALLRNIITTKLIAIGYTQEGVNGDDLFFSYDAPLSAAPKDRVFLRINAANNTETNIKIQTWFGDGYSSNNLVNSTNSFNDNQTGASNIGYSSNENFPIRFITFSSSEIAWLGFVRNDNNNGVSNIGFIFPSIKPMWWNNNSIYAFSPNSSDASRLRCCIVNPFTNNANDICFAPEFQPNNINPGGTRDLIRRIILNSQTNGNVCGATSSDLGVLAANGMNPFTQLSADGQTWVNCRQGGYSLAVRIL